MDLGGLHRSSHSPRQLEKMLVTHSLLGGTFEASTVPRGASDL